MRSVRNTRLAKGIGIVLLISTFATGALAQARPWDQKAVTAIAENLERALRDLRVTVRRNPQAPVGSTMRRAQFKARETLGQLVTTSQRLATQLRAGEDLDATLPTVRRLQMLRRDAEQTGRRADIPAPTLERIVSAQTLIDQLMAFYGQAAAEEDAAERAESTPPPTKTP